MVYVPGANTTLAGNADTPGSSSATQDSIYGISKTLGQVPVAISVTPTVSKMVQGLSRDPQGGTLTSGGVETQNWQTVLSDFYEMPASTRQAVQQQLLQAGFYPASYYGANPPMIVPGEADPGSYEAWRNAVEATVRESAYDDASKTLKNPKTVGQVLQERIANRQQQGLAGAVNKPQVAVMSPDDIRAAVVSQAKTQYGHKADENLIDSIIQHYQQLESQAQTSNAATVVKAPDVSAYAQAQLQAANPGDVALNKGLELGNVFMQAFQASAGNQPAPSGGSGG